MAHNPAAHDPGSTAARTIDNRAGELTVSVTDDRGATFRRAVVATGALAADTIVEVVRLDAARAVVVVGDEATTRVYRTTNGGQTWSPVSPP